MNSFNLRLDKGRIRFFQDYAYRSTIEAKLLIMHIKLSRGENWRAEIDNLSGTDAAVLRELNLPLIDQSPPIHIVGGPDRGVDIVVNGVHSTLAYIKKGMGYIPAIIAPGKYNDGTKLYTYDQLRIL